MISSDYRVLHYAFQVCVLSIAFVGSVLTAFSGRLLSVVPLAIVTAVFLLSFLRYTSKLKDVYIEGDRLIACSWGARVELLADNVIGTRLVGGLRIPLYEVSYAGPDGVTRVLCFIPGAEQIAGFNVAGAPLLHFLRYKESV